VVRDATTPVVPIWRVDQIKFHVKVYKIQVKNGAVKTSEWLQSSCLISMGRGPTLTEHERGRVRGLHEAGLTLRAIARQVMRAHTTVKRVVS
ncbi:hypothetical protein PybrP1_013213, partial [[Pythium] brassicae (nom. inval.)]